MSHLLAKGKYIIKVNFAGDGVFSTDAKNATVTVRGFETPLIVSYSTPVVITENVTVTVVMDKDLTDNVTVTIDGYPSTKMVVAGKLVFDINATYGEHNIAVGFKGNDKYYAAENSTSFTVNKLDIDLSVGSDSVDYGEDLVVNVTTNEKFTGDLTVYVGDYNQTAHVINGVGSVVFAGLARGDYFISVKFNETELFSGDAKNTQATVIGVNTPLVIVNSNPVINENVTVTVVMDYDFNDNVTVNLNGVSQSRAVVNGSFAFVIENVTYGYQNITVSFNGNDKYYPVENSSSFFVDYMDTNITITAEPVTYGEALVVVVNADDKFTGDVVVAIGNLTQTAHVVNGQGNVTFAGLSAAEYSISATFTGDGRFARATANPTGIVKGIEVPSNQTMDTNIPANKDTPTFSFNLTNATGNFTITVDGKDVATKELVNGSASITLEDLPAGDHNITLKYSGNGQYAPIIQSNNITINKRPTTISASSVSTVYGVSKTLTITLKDADNVALSNKTVIIVLNGVTYTRTTNSKGQVSLAVSNRLAVKTYTVKITFNGDSQYLKSGKDVKVTVKKAKSKITAKNKTFRTKFKTKKYTATLKANNKPIKKVKLYLKFKKKTYSATTNSKGKSTFKIKLKKGKYIAMVKFKGNSFYKASSKKVKIVIK